jgi:hypothetical protein
MLAEKCDQAERRRRSRRVAEQDVARGSDGDENQRRDPRPEADARHTHQERRDERRYSRGDRESQGGRVDVQERSSAYSQIDCDLSISTPPFPVPVGDSTSSTCAVTRK